ncbi:MAG: hypothetical protein RLZZ371_2407 [Pseudomonadota bacterium]
MKLKRIGTLQLALGVSVAVHAALLTVRLVDPEAFNRIMQDSPLEVILVNANPQERPEKAQAIAQFAMAGGGEAERDRAKSPLPPAMQTLDGQDKAQEQERQLREMQAQQNLLLLNVKRLLSSLPPTEQREPTQSAEEVQREQKEKQLIKLLAEIERRINLENSRPKKRYISPATREAVYAVYYDHLRRTIEERGTVNFPQANGQKIYGELIVYIPVYQDGSIYEKEGGPRIEKTSGNRMLDHAALAIVRRAAPFGSFPKGALGDGKTHVWDIITRYRITRDEILETSAAGG